MGLPRWGCELNGSCAPCSIENFIRMPLPVGSTTFSIAYRAHLVCMSRVCGRVARVRKDGGWEPRDRSTRNDHGLVRRMDGCVGTMVGTLGVGRGIGRVAPHNLTTGTDAEAGAWYTACKAA